MGIQKKKKEKKKGKNQTQFDGEDSELVYMYVNPNCNDQNGEYAKVNNSMNKNSNPTCVHVSKLHHSGSCWQLD